MPDTACTFTGYTDAKSLPIDERGIGSDAYVHDAHDAHRTRSRYSENDASVKAQKSKENGRDAVPLARIDGMTCP